MLENIISAKLIASGDIFEFFLYDVDVYASDDKKKKRINEIKVHEIPITLDDKLSIRKGNVMRAARNLRRIINTNVGMYKNNRGGYYKPVFVTLNFGRLLTVIKDGNNEFTLFIKRLNYYLYGDKKARLKYVAVLEFQKRGALHYHCIFFNLPYISNVSNVIGDLWKQGFIKINAIDKIQSVGSYVVKYMTKEVIDERLLGFKIYQASQGLFKPVVITDFYKVAELLNSCNRDFAFEQDLESEFVGKFKYIRIDLSRFNMSILKFVNPAYMYKEVVDNSVLTPISKQLSLGI
jgi:hypothetical protein